MTARDNSSEANEDKEKRIKRHKDGLRDTKIHLKVKGFCLILLNLASKVQLGLYLATMGLMEGWNEK